MHAPHSRFGYICKYVDVAFTDTHGVIIVAKNIRTYVATYLCPQELSLERSLSCFSSSLTHIIQYVTVRTYVPVNGYLTPFLQECFRMLVQLWVTDEGSRWLPESGLWNFLNRFGQF